MNRLFLYGLPALMLLPIRASSEDAFQFFAEEAKVITASKKEQTLANATSVMTVITAADIELWGARTLYEVLKRVPGFFPTSQASWPLLGSRGLLSDSNDHILLLVDGHPQNSIVGQGFQQQDLLPTLDKVKRIEIVRGPGSVLWGSNAVFGVINVITLDGSESPSSTKVTYGYGQADGMMHGNVLYRFRRDTDVNGMVSGSYWGSNGYNRTGRSGAGAAFTQTDAVSLHGNVEFPWGVVGDWPAIDQQREGYELYGKFRIGNDQILGRVVEVSEVYPWDTWLQKGGSDMRTRKAYLEHRHHAELNDRVTLDSQLYGDMLIQTRFPVDTALFQPSGGSTVLQDQSNEETAFGAELTSQIRLSKNNDLMLGAKGVRTKIGPNRDSRFDSFLNVANSTSLPHVGVESGYDNDVGLYFEDHLKLWEDRTQFFAGGRFDYNDFREEKGVFLPRAGVTQALAEDWTLKYVVNTGYLRPEAVYAKTVGVIADPTRGPTQGILRVTKSERIVSHDLQTRWARGKDYAAVTFFLMTVNNYISFDANNVPQGYKNLGDVTTRGVEVEGRHYWIAQTLASYANYSFAKACLDNDKNPAAIANDTGETLNYPQHLWNLGSSWFINSRHSLNVNLNGWAHMPIVWPITTDTPGRYVTLAGESYVDVSYQARQLFSSPIDLTLSITNLLDNTHAVGMAINNGWWFPRGRNLGLKLSYQF